MIRKIYLSGRIDGLSYEAATAARKEAKQLLAKVGIDALDPMRGKDSLKNLEVIDARTHTCEMQEIVTRDLADIRAADAVLVLTGDEPSWGTGMEAGYALAIGKPLFVISTKTARYGWLHFHAVKVYPKIEEMVRYISVFYNALT